MHIRHFWSFVPVYRPAWDWLCDNERYYDLIMERSKELPYDLPWKQEYDWVRDQMKLYQDKGRKWQSKEELKYKI